MHTEVKECAFALTIYQIYNINIVPIFNVNKRFNIGAFLHNLHASLHITVTTVHL
jgi:hypothetical protein